MHKFLSSYHPVNYACILCNSTCYMGTFMSLNDVTDTKAFKITVTNSTSMQIALSLHFVGGCYAAN